MTEAVAHLARPQRWDAPFGPDMTDADVQRLLARPEFAGIDATRFPRNTPLAGILKNDARKTYLGCQVCGGDGFGIREKCHLPMASP